MFKKGALFFTVATALLFTGTSAVFGATMTGPSLSTTGSTAPLNYSQLTLTSAPTAPAPKAPAYDQAAADKMCPPVSATACYFLSKTANVCEPRDEKCYVPTAKTTLKATSLFSQTAGVLAATSCVAPNKMKRNLSLIACFAKDTTGKQVTQGHCVYENRCTTEKVLAKVMENGQMVEKWVEPEKVQNVSVGGAVGSSGGGSVSGETPKAPAPPPPITTNPAGAPGDYKPAPGTGTQTGSTQAPPPSSQTPPDTISNTAGNVPQGSISGSAPKAPAPATSGSITGAPAAAPAPSAQFSGSAGLTKTGSLPSTGAPAAPTTGSNPASAATNPSQYTQQPSTFASANTKTGSPGNTTGFDGSYSSPSAASRAVSAFTSFIASVGSTIASAGSGAVEYVRNTVSPPPSPKPVVKPLTLNEAFPRPMQTGSTQTSTTNTAATAGATTASPTQISSAGTISRQIILSTSQLSPASGAQMPTKNTLGTPYTDPDLIGTNHQVRSMDLPIPPQTSQDASAIDGAGSYQAQARSVQASSGGKPLPSSSLSAAQNVRNSLPTVPVSAIDYSADYSSLWSEKPDAAAKRAEEAMSALSHWAPPSAITAGTPVAAGISTSNLGVFINTLVGKWTRGIPTSWEQAQMDLAIAEAQSNMTGLLAQIDAWKLAQEVKECDAVCESSLQALEFGRPIQEATIKTLLQKRADAKFAMETARPFFKGSAQVGNALVSCEESGLCSVQDFPKAGADPKPSAVMSYEYATRFIDESAVVQTPGPTEQNTKQQIEEISIRLNQLQSVLQEMIAPRAQGALAENSLPRLNAVLSNVIAKEGLDLYTDSDYDGISDYDEIHIYETNPRSAHTGGSNLTDGERVLFGLDVHTSTTERIAVESPRLGGATSTKIFEVYSIDIATSTIDAESKPIVQETTITGRALPNSFVTLYVFSTPVVVTVRADSQGLWSYTFDMELEDGDHELYVASIDSSGKIIAKSPAVPFFKRATAAVFTPLLMNETPVTDPLDTLRYTLISLAIVSIILFGIIGIVILGFRKTRLTESKVA